MGWVDNGSPARLVRFRQLPCRWHAAWRGASRLSDPAHIAAIGPWIPGPTGTHRRDLGRRARHAVKRRRSLAVGAPGPASQTSAHPDPTRGTAVSASCDTTVLEPRRGSASRPAADHGSGCIHRPCPSARARSRSMPCESRRASRGAVRSYGESRGGISNETCNTRRRLASAAIAASKAARRSAGTWMRTMAWNTTSGCRYAASPRPDGAACRSRLLPGSSEGRRRRRLERWRARRSDLGARARRAPAATVSAPDRWRRRGAGRRRAGPGRPGCGRDLAAGCRRAIADVA